jgi:hypothetical protein
VKAVFAKRKSSLVPVGDEAWDALCKLSEGQMVSVEVKASRNIQRLRLAWALAGAVFENTDYFPSRDAAMDAIKLGTGHCETWIDPATGEVKQRPMSIAFEKLEEIDFAQFVDRAVTLITVRWFQGMPAPELLERVNQILDGSQARQAAKQARAA